MKKVFFLFFILTLAHAEDLLLETERKKKIESLVDQEMAEVKKMNERSNDRDPDLLLRLSELNLQKARISFEKENDILLKKSPELQSESGKNTYASSQKYFLESQRYAQKLLQKFPSYTGKADVYYILGSNAKEFKKYKEAKKYLSASIKTSQNADLSYKAKSLLADLYYNDREFSSAINLYNQILQKNDKWWTRNAYNLAWCYYETNQYNKALSLMEEVYERSKTPSYIDMSAQVERDIALFYISVGNLDAAVSFYKKIGKDISRQLVQVARFFLDKNYYAKAEDVLREASTQTRDEKLLAEISLMKLELFYKYRKDWEHLSESQKLLAFYQRGLLSAEQKTILSFECQKMGALLQKEMVSKTYQDLAEKKKEKAKLSISYFNILELLEKEGAYKNLYAQAESFYSIKDYGNALIKYDKAYDSALASHDMHFRTLSAKALIATLGVAELSEETKENYYLSSYEKYLSVEHKSTTANQIYQKTFKIYMQKKKILEAEELYFNYRSDFYEERQVQESMIAEIMDFHYREKNYAQYEKWVKKIRNNEVQVSDNFAKESMNNLSRFEIAKAQQNLAEGKGKQAMSSYIKVYNSAESPQNMRANAAYNMATIYHDEENSSGVSQWAERALNLSSTTEVIPLLPSYLTLTAFLFGKREFVPSASLSQRSFQKICQEKTEYRDAFFKNTILILLADKKIDEAINFVQKGKQCGTSQEKLVEAEVEILRVLMLEKKWEYYESRVRSLEQDPTLRPYLITPLFQITRLHKEESPKITYKKILDFYQEAKKNNKKIPVEGLDVVADIYLQEARIKIKNLEELKLQFPEGKFNNTLQKKLNLLESLYQAVTPVWSTGSGKGIIKSYRLLIENYENLALQLEKFNPPVQDKNYKSSFQKSMQSIVEPLRKKAQEYRMTAKNQITKYNVLSRDNFFILSPQVPFEFYSSDLNRFIKIMSEGGM